MGWARSREPHQSRSTGTDAIDLLGFAFNVPTRHDLRRHREISKRREKSRASDSGESDSNDFDESDASSASGSESEDDDMKTRVIYVPSRHRGPNRHTPLQKTSKKSYRRASSSPSSDFDSDLGCEKKQKKKPRSSPTRSPIPKKLSKIRKSHKDSAEILTTMQPSAPVVTPQHFQHSVFISPSAPHGPVQTPHQILVNHMFAPRSQPIYLAPPPYFAAQYVTPSPQATTNSNSCSSLQNIERIQHEINHLEQSQLPLKKKGHAEQLKKLHDELNATLDAATMQTSGIGSTVSNQELGQALQPDCDPLTTTIPRQKQTANDLSHPEGTNPRTGSSQESLRYHLCSNCGNVRSQRFHQKHPMRLGQKALFNHCESCRVTRSIQDGSNSYHFCFGCGLVRSKMYQVAHPVQKGCSMPPNYCRKCVQEVKQDETPDDTSIPEGSSLVSTLLATQLSRLDGNGILSSEARPMQHTSAGQESRFTKRSRRPYKRPFVEDSSSVTHGIAEDAGQENDHDHGRGLKPVDVLSEESVKEYARRSSRGSEDASRYSPSNKSVSFDLDNFHGGSDHDSERDIRTRGGTEFASATCHQVPRMRSNRQRDRSREARPSLDRESNVPRSHTQSGSKGAPMARSAFAGMHFAPRNRFGPPTAPAPLSQSPSHAHSSCTLNDETDHTSMPDHRASRSAQSCSENFDGRSPEGKEKPRGTRARSSSSFSTGTTTFTAFTPTSPNPYYTPQTSPSLFEDGIFERINLRKRRADRKKHGKGQMYEPTPITEEILSVMDEEMDPILLIDCIPYSDETASISSPECAWSSSNSADAAR